TTHRSPRRATPPIPPPGTRLSGPGRHRRPRGRRREGLWTVLAAVALVLAGSTPEVLTRDPTTGPVSDAGPPHEARLMTAPPDPELADPDRNSHTPTGARATNGTEETTRPPARTVRSDAHPGAGSGARWAPLRSGRVAGRAGAGSRDADQRATHRSRVCPTG